VAYDPYGYRGEEPPPERTGDSGAFSAVTGLAWLGLSAVVCFGCSGVMLFGEEAPGDQWYDKVGVWMLLSSPAWGLAGIAVATGLLHGLARQWWTAAGPNVVWGGCGGCLVWGVVFVGWVLFAVAMDG
jgi:hypothetical protein